MAKYLKITPPTGFPVVVPDTSGIKAHYEKLNVVLEREKKTVYRIEQATEREVAEFNPVASRGK
jgi:hypothetical protein